MKMHYYFLLNIKHGASQLYLGAQIQLWGPGGGAAEGGAASLMPPGGEASERPPGEGLQLSSAGTGVNNHYSYLTIYYYSKLEINIQRQSTTWS